MGNNKKHVLISGGTRGIGKELAILYATSGYNVSISYVNSTKEAEELEKIYGIYAVKANSKNILEVESFYQKCTSRFGKIDVVINNAGICLEQKLLIDTTEEDFDNLFNVNVKGVYNLLKVSALNMLSSSGVIVNVSSIWGLLPASCEAIYSATKSAVNSLTTSVALELEHSSVTVFAVALGLIDTDMNKRLTTLEKQEFCKSLGLDFIPTAKMTAAEIFNLTNKNRSEVHGKVIPLFCGEL